jgi:hypothetical protein
MTPASVIPQVEPYLAAFAQGALAYAQQHGTRPERVSLLAAICLRETHAGWAPGYRPRGSPTGTGDWVLRTGHWTHELGVVQWPDTGGFRSTLKAAGWSLPRDSRGEVLPGPYATPRDGRGWGRGLFQLDILGACRDLIPPPDAPWQVDLQAYAAAQHMDIARRVLRDVTGDAAMLERAVVVAYNAGAVRAAKALRSAVSAGRPDAIDDVTTGHDYSRDVLALEAAVAARWPDTAVEIPVPPRSA